MMREATLVVMTITIELLREVKWLNIFRNTFSYNDFELIRCFKLFAIILKIGSVSLKCKWLISLQFTIQCAYYSSKTWRFPYILNLPNIKRIIPMVVLQCYILYYIIPEIWHHFKNISLVETRHVTLILHAYLAYLSISA